MVLEDGVDSVDYEYGNEYSEETKNRLRGFRRPHFLSDEDSLDPVSEMEDFYEHNLRLPPSTYDAMREAADDELEQLRRVREVRLTPEEEATAAYRQKLVDGTSPEDLRWLKLKAFHRGVDAIRAQRDSPEARRQQLLEHEVPLDRVPAELLDLTPEQLVERRRSAQQAGQRTAAARRGSNVAYSEDSEWDPSWRSQDRLQHPTEQLALRAAAAHALALLQPVAEAATSPPSTKEREGVAEAAAAAAFPGDAAAQHGSQRRLCYGYTPEYRAHLALQEEVQRQRRQSALAFWGGLGLTLASVAVRTLLRSRKRAGAGSKGGKALGGSTSSPSVVSQASIQQAQRTRKASAGGKPSPRP